MDCGLASPFSGAASLASYAVFSQFTPEVIEGTAGAILAMLADTMIPHSNKHTA